MKSNSKNEIDIFREEFKRLMVELDMFNKYSKTYRLTDIEPTDYGFVAKLYLNTGLSFSKLQNNVPVIQENLRCLWIMKVKQFSKYAKVDIITNPLDLDIEYEVPKIKPWEMHMGVNFSLQSMKNNNNDYCMFLLAGATGSGKTRFMYMVLLSWILNCKTNEVELYISDVAKNEYVNFQYVQHVKSYASELDELLEMMRIVKKKIQYRKNLISKQREMGLATNIQDYNKIKDMQKLSYCYTIIDEFSAIIPDTSDSKRDNEMKQEILDTVKYISKIGRSLGMFLIVSTQKTTRDEIPSIIKNMSAVRISFRANDSVSSEVIIGDRSACGLGDRIAVYSQNGGSDKDYLFSPKITMEKLNELLEPYVKRKKKTFSNQELGMTVQKKVINITPKRRTRQEWEQFFKKEDGFIDY